MCAHKWFGSVPSTEYLTLWQLVCNIIFECDVEVKEKKTDNRYEMLRYERATIARSETKKTDSHSWYIYLMIPDKCMHSAFKHSRNIENFLLLCVHYDFSIYNVEKLWHMKNCSSVLIVDKWLTWSLRWFFDSSESRKHHALNSVLMNSELVADWFLDDLNNIKLIVHQLQGRAGRVDSITSYNFEFMRTANSNQTFYAHKSICVSPMAPLEN